MQVNRVKAKGPVSSVWPLSEAWPPLRAGPCYVMLPQSEHRVGANQSPLSEGGSGFPRPLLQRLLSSPLGFAEPEEGWGSALGRFQNTPLLQAPR